MTRQINGWTVLLFAGVVACGGGESGTAIPDSVPSGEVDITADTVGENDGDECAPNCAAEGEAFAIFPSGSTYSIAANHCKTLGGFLAWIHSDSENQLAAEICESNSSSNWGCLLGLITPFKNWENGDAVEYTPKHFWTHDGEPHGFIYNANDGGSNYGYWEDKDQDQFKFPYICRLPLSADLSEALASVQIP